MKFLLRLPVLVIISVVIVAGSLLIGPAENISAAAVIRWFWEMMTGTTGGEHDLISVIILDVRLPRILLTFLIGSALALSGNTLQSVFRNPLVDPYILGISSGAAFGAALALATAFLPVQLSAFIFGSAAVFMSYWFARMNKIISTVALILAGIVVSGIFTALLTIVQFLSDPFKLQTIVHWIMGNLHTASWSKLHSAFLPIFIGMTVLYLWRWRLNVLALGDDEALTAGINPRRERMIVLGAATLATSAAVAVAGIIGFYGLLIPHMVRMMAGADNRRTSAINIAAGGSFLVLIDDLSRSLTAFEIPIGVFTMLLGTPFFILLMKKTRIGWQE
jgi:iron complex transport system permease protein